MSAILRRRRAFTLLELLLALTILSFLAGLLLPSLGSLLDRSRAVACANNLRQIGVCSLLSAADNNQRLPIVEPWPSHPIYTPEAGAQTLSEALASYGLSARSLQCRCDTTGPGFFAREGSSYQWFPGASGQSLHNIQPKGVSAANLLLAFDYSGVHRDASNVLFADGHVSGAVGGR